jgi:hypothetical protein
LIRLVPLLVAVAFLDELASGIPFVGAPEIRSEFGVSYTQAAGWLLLAIAALGVHAVLTLFGVMELPLPIVIGTVADGFGLGVALAMLVAQPVGIALVVVSSRTPFAPR